MLKLSNAPLISKHTFYSALQFAFRMLTPLKKKRGGLIILRKRTKHAQFLFECSSPYGRLRPVTDSTLLLEG